MRFLGVISDLEKAILFSSVVVVFSLCSVSDDPFL